MIERFRNSPAKSQVAIVMAALALVSLLLTALWFGVFRVDYKPIFSHLRPADAAAIVGELDKRKIPYRLGDAGTTIAVPEGQADAVRLRLADSDAVLKGDVGFELFDKSDMGITDFAQKIDYQRALQGELERTISTLDGVENARVHLSMGDNRLFRQDRAPPKASVTLRMHDRGEVPPGTVAGVQQLVSAAVPLLDPSAVVVLDEAGVVMSAADAAGLAGGAVLPPEMAEKAAIEQYYAARARSALEGPFGPDYFAVDVVADVAKSGSAAHFDMKNRTFPLQVGLRPRSELAGRASEDARAIVAKVVGLNAALGDTIVFEAPQPFASNMAQPSIPAPRALRLTSPSPAPDSPDANAYLAVSGIGFGLLCLALLIWLLFRRRPRPLDEEARLGFAERLKSLLDEEAADERAQA
jgi:flagellar M-ring protein FliF